MTQPIIRYGYQAFDAFVKMLKKGVGPGPYGDGWIRKAWWDGYKFRQNEEAAERFKKKALPQPPQAVVVLVQEYNSKRKSRAALKRVEDACLVLGFTTNEMYSLLAHFGYIDHIQGKVSEQYRAKPKRKKT